MGSAVAAVLPLVADVYLEACEAGEPPTKKVRETFGVAPATAGIWVARARSAGLIPDAGQGEQLARNPKVLRVAQALGIPYDALYVAIQEQAGGDIRLGRGA